MSDDATQPIELSLGAGLPPTRFADLPELIAAIEHEVQFWSAIADRVASVQGDLPRGGNPQDVAKHLRTWRAPESIAKGIANGSHNLNQLRDHLQTHTLPPSGSALAAAIDSLSVTDPHLCYYVCAFLQGNIPAEALRTDSRHGAPYLKQLPAVMVALSAPTATVRAAKQAAAARTRAERAAEDGGRLVDEFATAADDATKSFAELMKRLDEDATAALGVRDEKANAFWSDIQKDYEREKDRIRRALSLSEPLNFWRDKTDTHGFHALGWGVLSVAVIALMALVPGVVAPWLDLSVQKITTHEILRPVLALGAPLFLLLWAARFGIRQTSEQLLRREDAHERAIMISTYLALTSHENIPSQDAGEHMTHLLAAVFRPGPGFSGDDSPPATTIEAVARFFNAKPK